jgi:RPA family protein
MADSQPKRQTAYYCTARQLLDGSYVERDGWEPNFVATDAGAVSRVRVVGVVVDTNDSSFLVDDGSGRLPVRSFDSSLPSVKAGDVVLVIGRPRLFDGDLYVLSEVARKLPSAKWLKYYSDHKDELQRFIPDVPAPDTKDEVSEEKATSSSQVSGEDVPAGSDNGEKSPNQAEAIIGAIRELDPGDGAPVDEVLSKAGFPEAEQRLQSLISEGEVFELRAGKVKVLE